MLTGSCRGPGSGAQGEQRVASRQLSIQKDPASVAALLVCMTQNCCAAFLFPHFLGCHDSAVQPRAGTVSSNVMLGQVLGMEQ